MSFKIEFAGRHHHPRLHNKGKFQNRGLDLDPELAHTLDLFRRSVHAWSGAVFQRPRSPLPAARHRSLWRLASAWTLGLVLLAGGLSAGLYHHHQQELARIAAQQKAAQQKLLAEKRARDLDEMLAKVDSDVSREVPSAMEPLAELADAADSR